MSAGFQQMTADGVMAFLRPDAPVTSASKRRVKRWSGSLRGRCRYLVDSNVWIDCIDAVSPWHEWSVDHLQICGECAPLHINLVINTELLMPRAECGSEGFQAHRQSWFRSDPPKVYRYRRLPQPAHR